MTHLPTKNRQQLQFRRTRLQMVNSEVKLAGPNKARHTLTNETFLYTSSPALLHITCVARPHRVEYSSSAISANALHMLSSRSVYLGRMAESHQGYLVSFLHRDSPGCTAACNDLRAALGRNALVFLRLTALHQTLYWYVR